MQRVRKGCVHYATTVFETRDGVVIVRFGEQTLLHQLGDDSARGLGVRLQLAQAAVLLVAVGLAAFAVSAAGPIDFVAFVVPRAGAEPRTEELVAWAREQIGGYKYPRQIRVTEALPRTSIGKVDRRRLRELAAVDARSRS